MSQARKAPRYKLIGGFPHIRIRSGAYRRIHEIVGGVLDGAIQIKTKRRWKWMKGPRRKPGQKATAPGTLAAILPAVLVRPPGHQLVIWTRKYDVLKPNAAMPQN